MSESVLRKTGLLNRLYFFDDILDVAQDGIDGFSQAGSRDCIVNASIRALVLITPGQAPSDEAVLLDTVLPVQIGKLLVCRGVRVDAIRGALFRIAI